MATSSYCMSLTTLSTPMSKQGIMLVLGTGSVFPRSSIHPKHSCSLPESLDTRVKREPHKMAAQNYMHCRLKNFRPEKNFRDYLQE